MIKVRVSQLKAGVLLSYLSMGLGYVVALVYTPIMLRLLGKSEYGLYNLVLSVVAFLGVLNFGFGSTYTRFFLKYKVEGDQEGAARLNGMFLIIFCAIGLLAMAASTVMALNAEALFGSELTAGEHEKARVLLLILTANLSISFPGIVFSSHITANERFVFQNLINMLKTVFNPFISLPLLLLGYGSVGLAIATAAVTLLIEASNILYCFRKLRMRFAFRGFDPALLKRVTHFSFFIFINLLIDQINWSVDKFILGRFHGTATVAVYGVAAQINGYYLGVSSAISNVFIPRVHKMIAAKEDNRLSGLFARIGRIQFAVLALLALCLVFFGRMFFILWAGPDFSDSYPIALLLILPVTIPLVQSIGIEIQRAKDMHRFRSLVYLGIALLNVVLTLLLAREYKGVGAAFATAVALLLGNGIIMNWYYQRRVGIDVGNFWKQIARMVPGLLPPAAVGYLMSLFLPMERWLHLLGYVALFSAAYGLSMWFWGFNDYERGLLASPARKLKARLLRPGRRS